MARDSGRNQTRDSIAHLAARLMAEDGIEDYAQAKRKAARQVGATDARHLPNNDEIAAALNAYRELYRPDHPAQLREIRQLALTVMRELAAFNPYLTGSVLKGSAGSNADIQLQLFTDSVKSVEHYLLDRNVRYRPDEARFFAGDTALVAPVFIFNRDGCDFHLAVLSPRDLRRALKTTIAGRPLERAKVAAVEALLDGS
ncbi:MAG: UDP-N-acetylmuramate--alanine ligase [Burkholderiales bacterium]